MSTHEFKPTKYYNTMGPHQPVMHIKDGDSVVTTTIDSHGYDQNLNKVSSSPNPMTGPFYVENAEPGDTLAVTFEYMKPNRDRKSTRLNSSHVAISYAVFCLKKKIKINSKIKITEMTT